MKTQRKQPSADVQKLLAEADSLLNELLGSSLSKNEKSLQKKGFCKDEDKQEEEKDDKIFYENQSPELADKQKEDDQQDEEKMQDQQAPEDQQQDDKQFVDKDKEQNQDQEEEFSDEDFESIIQSLSDESLAELYEKLKQEMMKRLNQNNQKDEEVQQEGQQQEQPQDLKMSENYKKILAQKDAKIAELTKSVYELLDIVDGLTSKPVSKAHNGLDAVPTKLQKNEPLDLKKSIEKIMGNELTLQKLTKSEINVLVDYYTGQRYKGIETKAEEIVKRVI